jgi:hypothetical protein
MTRILAALACTTLIAAAPAAPPRELDVARKAFIAAIVKHDAKAIAALTNFPVLVEEYQVAPRITEAQFKKKSAAITGLFGNGAKELVDCVGSGPLTLQTDRTQFGAGMWLADCNGNEYFFAQHGGKWLFAAYQNINE